MFNLFGSGRDDDKEELKENMSKIRKMVSGDSDADAGPSTPPPRPGADDGGPDLPPGPDEVRSTPSSQQSQDRSSTERTGTPTPPETGQQGPAPQRSGHQDQTGVSRQTSGRPDQRSDRAQDQPAPPTPSDGQDQQTSAMPPAPSPGSDGEEQQRPDQGRPERSGQDRSTQSQQTPAQVQQGGSGRPTPGQIRQAMDQRQPGQGDGPSRTGQQPRDQDRTRSETDQGRRGRSQRSSHDRSTQDQKSTDTSDSGQQRSVSADEVPEAPEMKEITVPDVNKGPLFIRVKKFKEAKRLVDEMGQLGQELETSIGGLRNTLDEDDQINSQLEDTLTQLEDSMSSMKNIVSPE